jgi:hypothetical protein
MANGRRTTTRNAPPPPAGSVPLVVDNGEEQRLADLPPVFPGGGAAAAPITASAVEERRDVELDDILNELGGDSRIRVYHVVDGRSAFAGELGAENFTLDTVLEHFGGGEKTLKIYQGRNHVTTARILLDVRADSLATTSAVGSGKATEPRRGRRVRRYRVTD